MDFFTDFAGFIVENPVYWIAFMLLLVVAIYLSSYWNYCESPDEEVGCERKQNLCAQGHLAEDNETGDELRELKLKIAEANIDRELDDLLSETLRSA